MAFLKQQELENTYNYTNNFLKIGSDLYNIKVIILERKIQIFKNNEIFFEKQETLMLSIANFLGFYNNYIYYKAMETESSSSGLTYHSLIYKIDLAGNNSLIIDLSGQGYADSYVQGISNKYLLFSTQITEEALSQCTVINLENEEKYTLDGYPIMYINDNFVYFALFGSIIKTPYSIVDNIITPSEEGMVEYEGSFGDNTTERLYGSIENNDTIVLLLFKRVEESNNKYNTYSIAISKNESTFNVAEELPLNITYRYMYGLPAIIDNTYDINLYDMFEDNINKLYILSVALFVRQYVIRFLNYDNSVLQSSKIDENTMPEFSGVEPTREHYNFIGWTPEIAIATQDQDYVATFEAMKYQIRFLNGTVVLQDTMVSYGEIPTYTGEEPTKEGHTFIGWSPTIYAVDKNQDYQATFSINTYLITFASEDGIPLETKEVEYGETPEYTGEEPTKEGYVFLGWTPTPYPANKNQTYTPRFRINSFTIRFLGENDEVLQEETLEYGATPVYKGATPTKEHYDFAGWTPEIYPVNKNQDYKVKFTEHYYTITLLNEDGSLFTTVKALFGDPLDSLPTPEPEQEGYVFDKWLPDIQAVSGDATYTASFRIKTFTIRFLNYDGSVLQSEVLEYGATPVYKEDTPIKVGSTFLGWKPEIYSVNKDQDYTAQFSVATHNLVFKANGETLWQITYQGELTKIEVNTLVNLTLSFVDNRGQSSKQITSFENTTNISGFTINGQNYSVNKAHNVSYDSDIEANLTFYSTQHYRIRWNVDGIFQNEYSQIVESGTIPTYNGPTPSKEGHTFLGWTPTPYPADKNQDYAAILRSNDAFTITVRDSENKELNQAPDNNHDFGSDLIISKLRFKQSRITPYGQTISVFFNENTIADLVVIYDPEYNVEVNSVVIGGTTHFITSDDDEMNLLTPLQSSFEMIFYTRATYHIRFLDEDGTLLYQTYVGANETPRYVGELPSKDENYRFVGWTPSLAPATHDQDYTAVYERSGLKITSITNALDIPITNELPLLIHNQEVGATVNKVSVRSGIGDVEITFYFAKNYADGTQYSEKFTLTYDRNYLTQNNLNLPYTEEVVIDGNTIAADGEKHDIEFEADASISIEIHNKKTYLTRFLNYDNAVLYSTLTVDGETPVYVGDTPTRENYIFIGWSPSPYPADKNQDYIARFNVAFEIQYKSVNGTLKSYNAVKMVYKDGTNKIFTKARFDKKENN